MQMMEQITSLFHTWAVWKAQVLLYSLLVMCFLASLIKFNSDKIIACAFMHYIACMYKCVHVWASLFIYAHGQKGANSWEAALIPFCWRLIALIALALHRGFCGKGTSVTSWVIHLHSSSPPTTPPSSYFSSRRPLQGGRGGDVRGMGAGGDLSTPDNPAGTRFRWHQLEQSSWERREEQVLLMSV